jgi:hydroxymethylbilane synthase
MLVIGSRGSKLALWQSNWVKDQLAARSIPSRIEIIKTTGDKITDVPLAKVGTKGLFTKELEEALLAGDIDIAVHSLKDMPTELPEGCELLASPVREDPRDAIIGRPLQHLSIGAKVGTSSLRRTAQLLATRPDLQVESLRGNLDTRLRKLDEGHYEAILLAAAGLERLGWAARIAERLPVDVMCPAVGQGALAIEGRADDPSVYEMLQWFDDEPTRLCITAERTLLAALGGGCQVPIGAHAWLADGKLCMTSIVAAPDGTQIIRRNGESLPNEGKHLALDLARQLREAGAADLLQVAGL